MAAPGITAPVASVTSPRISGETVCPGRLTDSAQNTSGASQPRFLPIQHPPNLKRASRSVVGPGGLDGNGNLLRIAGNVNGFSVGVGWLFGWSFFGWSGNCGAGNSAR